MADSTDTKPGPQTVDPSVSPPAGGGEGDPPKPVPRSTEDPSGVPADPPPATEGGEPSPEELELEAADRMADELGYPVPKGTGRAFVAAADSTDPEVVHEAEFWTMPKPRRTL